MNSPHLRYKRIAVCLTAWVLSSVGRGEPVSAYRGDTPTPFDVAVERGMSRRLARELAGEPDARFGADIWIYLNCRLTSEAAQISENNTLCVGFEGDHIVILKLVPLRAIRELAATRKLEVISSRLKILLRDTARTAKSP